MTPTATAATWAAIAALTPGTALAAALGLRALRQRRTARARAAALATRAAILEQRGQAFRAHSAATATRWLDAHARAVTDGRCTDDCPLALDWRLWLTPADRAQATR